MGINLKTVTQNLRVSLWVAETSYHKDVGIWSLHRGCLHRDCGPIFLPFELLLAEALQLKVEEEDIWRVGLDVVNWVLILVSVSWSDGHGRSVKWLTRCISDPVSSLYKFCTIPQSILGRFSHRCLTRMEWAKLPIIIDCLFSLLSLSLSLLFNNGIWCRIKFFI